MFLKNALFATPFLVLVNQYYRHVQEARPIGLICEGLDSNPTTKVLK